MKTEQFPIYRISFRTAAKAPCVGLVSAKSETEGVNMLERAVLSDEKIQQMSATVTDIRVIKAENLGYNCDKPGVIYHNH